MICVKMDKIELPVSKCFFNAAWYLGDHIQAIKLEEFKLLIRVLTDKLKHKIKYRRILKYQLKWPSLFRPIFAFPEDYGRTIS